MLELRATRTPGYWPIFLSLLILLVPMQRVQARSLAEITKSKELRVCIAPIHPTLATVEPADCSDKCKFSGPAYDESVALAKSLGKGIQAKVIRLNFDEQFFNHEGKTDRDGHYTPERLASGKCDLYNSHLTKNEWRLKKVDFVVLYPSRVLVIASRPMKAQLKTVADLAGKTTGTEKDTSFHTWLQEQNRTAFAADPIKIKLMSTADSLAALDAGGLDFILADSTQAIWMTRHELKNAVVAFPVGPTLENGLAFRKEDKDLQAATQSFLDEQRKNPTSDLNRIWWRHFGRTLTEFIALIASIK